VSIGYYETLASINADGTALTAAARASMLQGAGGKQGLYTLAPNKLRIGDQLVIEASGRISCVVTTPGTARWDLSFGVAGTAAMDTLAIPLNVVAKTNVPWYLRMVGTVRVVGNAGNIFWQGFWLSEAALNVAVPSTGPGPGGNTLPYNTAPVVGSNVDMTVTTILDFNFTQTVATGSCTLHHYHIALLSSTGF
jgi:hypothetical protein